MKFNDSKRHEGGEGVNSITRVLNLVKSTVSRPVKNGAVVKTAGEITTSFMAKTNTKHWEPIMEGMKRLLKHFIDDQIWRHMPLSTALVTAKTLSLYKGLQRKGYTVKEWN